MNKYTEYLFGLLLGLTYRIHQNAKIINYVSLCNDSDYSINFSLSNGFEVEIRRSLGFYSSKFNSFTINLNIGIRKIIPEFLSEKWEIGIISQFTARKKLITVSLCLHSEGRIISVIQELELFPLSYNFVMFSEKSYNKLSLDNLLQRSPILQQQKVIIVRYLDLLIEKFPLERVDSVINEIASKVLNIVRR